MEQKKELKRFINFRPLFYCFLAFLFGICSSYKLFNGDALFISMVVISFVSLIVVSIIYRKWLVVFILSLSFILGIGAYYLGYSAFMGKSYTEQQNIVARVTDDIYENEYYYNLVLDDCFIEGKSSKGINLSVKKEGDIQFKTGDILSFTAYVENVHLWTVGNFNSYYVRDNTPYKSTVYASDVVIVHGDVKFDEKVRAALKNVLNENMSPENAGTAFAVLTGDKSLVDYDTMNTYRGAGIIHLLTVSGLHISFLILALNYIMKKLKVNKFVNPIILAILLLFYCYICGFAPSVVRASIMGLVFIIAPLFGKEYDKLTSLGIAGFLILFCNPLYALDVGFLMSISCVASIFYLSKPFTKAFSKFLPKYFAESMAISLSAEIGILPYLISFGQSLNLLSVLVNVLIIPFFGFLFILLVITTLLAFIPYLGFLLKLADWGFSGIYYVANFFNNTGAKITIKEFSPMLSALLFFLIFVASNFFMTSKKIKALIISCILAFSSIFILCDTLIPVTMNSVNLVCNYGDGSLFLKSKNGEVLYVGNSFYSVQEDFLDKHNVSKINYALATDCYYGGSNFRDGLRKFEVDTIYSYQDFTEAKEEVVVEGNCQYIAGDFVFEYVFFENKYVGLKIDFDNFSIFFATNQKLSYNVSKYIEEEISAWGLDFVYLANKSYFSQYFNNSTFVGGFYGDERADYSYSSNGNLSFNLEKRIIRGLD